MNSSLSIAPRVSSLLLLSALILTPAGSSFAAYECTLKELNQLAGFARSAIPSDDRCRAAIKKQNSLSAKQICSACKVLTTSLTSSIDGSQHTLFVQRTFISGNFSWLREAIFLSGRSSAGSNGLAADIS